jgi:dihydrodipicolinate synthase/N-acetylneuraminate lyase
MDSTVRKVLQRGVVIPAMPLALDAGRRLDERRQRALCRYYFASGAGGLAVGVHTTQFAIRDPKVGLFEPVLALAAEEFARADRGRIEPLVRVAGVVGPTSQAVAEAELARGFGYHAGLLSLAALKNASDSELIAHCNAVASVLPVVGFYLQAAVGGRVLPYSFWRRFAEIKNVAAIKIAPFNRYQTLDVVRAVTEAGRADVALYTGNDDNIVMDLVTPFHFGVGSGTAERRIVGGLLGQWAVWTKKAVELLEFCHGVVKKDTLPAVVPRMNVQLTDANAAFFDAANGFRGCIPGIHEVLRRQGLLENLVTLDEHETLSPGQAEEIDRVCRAYPHLNDDAFVEKHRDEWLRG